jgi:hypothetical protein
MEKETIEEAAENYVWDSLFPIEEKSSFMNGAKWQAEQDKNKYSEEEVIELLNKFDYYPTMYTGNSESDINEWFEQYKKK